MMDSAALSQAWQGYEFLASGDGQRLERWGNRVILRPESNALWPWKDLVSLPSWEGLYSGDRATGGDWKWRSPLPDPCVVRFRQLSFLIKPTRSKHLGLFPEQSSNWDWITRVVRDTQEREAPVRILNLFGYTGGATLTAAAAGASVTHVDSARAMVNWCSENARLSGLCGTSIRYIVEDAVTFLQREIRRGNRYDGIIMDPPSFGRGKRGELWKLSEHLPFLIDTAQEALTENPLFLLLNTYSDSVEDLTALITKRLQRLGGSCALIELGLTGALDGNWLPCGMAYRWSDGN
jgi:23S rRNA (cytosine1962-C5)-methyltransferase